MVVERCPVTGKIRYTEQRHALAHCVRLWKQGARTRDAWAYRCKKCRGWHVGHQPSPRRRRRR